MIKYVFELILQAIAMDRLSDLIRQLLPVGYQTSWNCIAVAVRYYVLLYSFRTFFGRKIFQ